MCDGEFGKYKPGLVHHSTYVVVVMVNSQETLAGPVR